MAGGSNAYDLRKMTARRRTERGTVEEKEILTAQAILIS
jgi:hypothetical protein